MIYMESELDHFRSSVGGWHHGTDRRRETVVKTDVGRRRDDDDVGGLFVLQCDDGVGRTPTAEWDCSLRGLPLVVETGGLCHDGAAAAVGGQRSNCGVGAVVHRPDHRRLHAPKNWTSVRWNAVMGTRYVYSRQAVAPYPWHLQALVVFIMIFLNLVATTEQSCRVEQCWQAMNSAVLTKNSTQAYCAALKTLSNCVRATARSCRGDLKYHSISTLLPQWINQRNCSSYVILNASSAPPVAMSSKPPKTQCDYHGKHEFQYCALFGDPHLHTFNNEQQTCKILKAWPLIDNAYLAVQVTNDAVLPGDSTATATTKVTVIIKGRDTNCAPHKTYEAQVDSLPSAFVDGTQGNGQERYVRIREKDPGRHVEIHIKYIATTIVIRRVGNYLTVAIRMPKEVVQQGMAEDGLDLCMKGCPAREQIDLVGFFREGDAEGSATAPGFTQKTAIANCLNHDLTDFHFDACVFDLMTTGDYTFGEAASKAAHDQKMLNREWMARQSNRTTLPTWVDSTSGGVEGSPGINSSYTLDGVAHGGVVGVAATTPVTLFLFVCCWIALVLGHPSRCCAAIVP